MALARDFARPDETIGQTVYRFAEEELTEERTDLLIDSILEEVRLPWGLGRIARIFLDRLLPEAALRIFRRFLQRVGQLPSDRAMHPGSPFRGPGS